MKISVLNQMHPEVDREEIEDFEALFEGGEEFTERIKRLLPQRPQEPDDVYRFRCKMAHFVAFAQQIIGYYVGGLFSSRIEYRTKDGTVPEWLGDFVANCDRQGTHLETFLQRMVKNAHVSRAAWVLIDFPEAKEAPSTLLDWQAQGLGNGYLCEVDTECVLDWECDEDGNLEWVIVHDKKSPRLTPYDSRNMVTETWRVYTKELWEKYEVTYEKGSPPSQEAEILPVASGPSPTPGFVPMVRLEFPCEVQLMPVLFSPLLELIRKRNALSWSLDRSSYAMRIFKLAEMRDLQVHGVGHGIVLGPDEDVKWDSPPADAFAPTANYIDEIKTEAYRSAHAMALSIGNSAAALGRSEGSKAMDFDAISVVMRFMGRFVLRALNRILGLLSIGKAAPETFQCSGLDEYEAQDMATLFDSAVKAQSLAIQSPTFNKLLKTRLAYALTPQASQQERDEIAKEIEDETAHASDQQARAIQSILDQAGGAADTQVQQPIEPSRQAAQGASGGAPKA